MPSLRNYLDRDRLLQTVRLSAIAARRYHTSRLRVYRRILRLYFRERFKPEEIFLLGLANPREPLTDPPRYVSKKNVLRYQHRLNPKKAGRLADDKTIFYSYCMALGLPVPKLYAVLNPPAGWVPEGSILQKQDDWETFVRDLLPETFVIKPAEGVHGHGVELLRKTPEGVVDTDGKKRTISEFCDDLCSSSAFGRSVIQERVRNHPAIEELSDTESLQTLRMVSLVTRSGSCRILYGCLRVIAGGATTDNFSFGQAANLVANIDFSNGTLGRVIGAGPNGIGGVTVPHHPKTRIDFEGFQIPFLDEACRLVQDAAPRFLPLRTLGWDVAVTPDGPVLIEANPTWDPPNLHGLVPGLMQELRAELEDLS